MTRVPNDRVPRILQEKAKMVDRVPPMDLFVEGWWEGRRNPTNHLNNLFSPGASTIISSTLKKFQCKFSSFVLCPYVLGFLTLL